MFISSSSPETQLLAGTALVAIRGEGREKDEIGGRDVGIWDSDEVSIVIVLAIEEEDEEEAGRGCMNEEVEVLVDG